MTGLLDTSSDTFGSTSVTLTVFIWQLTIMRGNGSRFSRLENFKFSGTWDLVYIVCASIQFAFQVSGLQDDFTSRWTKRTALRLNRLLSICSIVMTIKFRPFQPRSTYFHTVWCRFFDDFRLFSIYWATKTEVYTTHSWFTIISDADYSTADLRFQTVIHKVHLGVHIVTWS